MKTCKLLAELLGIRTRPAQGCLDTLLQVVQEAGRKTEQLDVEPVAVAVLDALPHLGE